MDKPRDYQERSINDIRERFREGFLRVLLWLATGAGKTFIFCRMVKGAVQNGKKCIVVVRGRKLVDQASKRLFREGVAHGVLMAGHWNYRPHENVQVCSIDTLISRNLTPEADLIIIDEAHLATSQGYVEFLSKYPKAFVVSVTATPYTPKGLRHVAETVVHPISMIELIEAKHLVPFRYFAPSTPDVSSVHVSSSTKDYVVGELAEVMSSGTLTGKVVDHWVSIAENRPTICFAVNIAHSKLLTQKFLMAGIAAEHCDADTSDSEREEIIQRLEQGVTKVVCNVGILCTGVDIPNLGAIIMARPTKSKNLFIQQAGRGTRNFPEKINCILLDHAGNIERHGLPTDEVDVDLDGRQKESTVKESKICKRCFAVFRGNKCPECQFEPPEAPIIDIEETDEKLKELKGVELDPILRAYKELQKKGKSTGRKSAWAMYKLVDRFGIDAARKHLPAWFVSKYDNARANIFATSPFRGRSKPVSDEYVSDQE